MANGLYVEAELKIYEIEGEAVEMGSNLKLSMQSHDDREDLVILSVADGRKITLSANAIKRAVEACTK